MRRIPAKTFLDLIVWQKAHQWVLWVYRYSEDFPKHDSTRRSQQIARIVFINLAPCQLLTPESLIVE